MSEKTTRLFSEHRAREKFQRKLEQLRIELRIESPRRVLDYLVEHAEDLLDQCGESLLTESFRRQLAEARRDVTMRHRLPLARPSLRLVPQPEPPKGAA